MDDGLQRSDHNTVGGPEDSAGRPMTIATSLLAMGIVYGDLGTSPLYTLQTITHILGDRFTTEIALGTLSLIFWSLIITVSIKYCLLVMRADNHGEGGILALMTMTGARWPDRGRSLIVMGLFGAALIYGDGIITPAISVLSALEGLNVVTEAFQPYTMPVAVVILFALFAIQSRGTAFVGKAFGPIMLLWFVTIAALGIGGIVQRPQVLAALNPAYGLSLLTQHGYVGFALLGGVFLSLTGAEALYADMGHIGRTPIRATWYGLVLPALVLNYAGQISLLLETPNLTGNPFFHLAPSWMVIPLVGLATIATIIASQAIITGSFSMTRQAMQLGWFPGVHIRQTSAEEYGQIYVPFINWTMMAFTIALTIGFGSSDRLAGAYGTAVSTTMVLTTGLLYHVMRQRWQWSAARAGSVAGLFLVVDLAFFAANLVKIREGGWIPLLLAAIIFVVMLTWRWGVTAVHRHGSRHVRMSDAFVDRLRDRSLPRVPGTAIFLTRFASPMTPAIMDYANGTGALHETVIALTVRFDPVPRVGRAHKVSIVALDNNIWHVTCRFGFVEIPNLPAALAQIAPGQIPDIAKAIYFIERDDIVGRPRRRLLSRWRVSLFAFMFRNATHAVDRFMIPPRSLVEIGRRIEI